MIERAIQDEPTDPAAAGTSHSKRASQGRTQPMACRMLVKVVPGSRSSSIVGMLGDRLKIKVAAPPEDGKANAAVCALMAETLGIATRAVEVIAGTSNPEKTLRVTGVSAADARSKLSGMV